MTRKLWSIVAALGLVLAACGGGGGDTAELADAVSDSIWEASQEDVESGDVPFEFSRGDADCLGEAVVDAVGYDRMVDAGATADAIRNDPDSIEGSFEDVLDAETGAALFDGMNDCLDLAAMMADAAGEDFGVSRDSAECLFRGFLDEPAFRDAFVLGLVGGGEVDDPFVNPDPALVGVLFELMTDCLSDEELANLMGAGVEQNFEQIAEDL